MIRATCEKCGVTVEAPYIVGEWCNCRKDAEIARLTKELADEKLSHGETLECIHMAQEAVGSILDEKPESIAPMFLPEAIRSACFRSSRGDYDAKCVTPTVTPLRAEVARLKTALRAAADALDEARALAANTARACVEFDWDEDAPAFDAAAGIFAKARDAARTAAGED